MYSLRDVDPIQPKSNAWGRSLTTEEVKARFPNLWDVSADDSKTRNPTQVKVTVSSYRKNYDYLKSKGFDGTILDASSGLGYGTKAASMSLDSMLKTSSLSLEKTTSLSTS